MAQVKKPEIFEKLKALEIVDLDPEEFQGTELRDILPLLLNHAGFTVAALEKQLDEEKRLKLLDIVQGQVVDLARHRYNDPDKLPAVNTLSGIRCLSSLFLSATHLEDMNADLANAYFQGHGSPENHFVETSANAANTTPGRSGETRSIRYDNEGGPMYYRIVNTCLSIANCWRRLPEELEEATAKKEAPQAVFDAFSKAVVQYKALIGQLTDGISQKGIHVEIVETLFRGIFMTHRMLFRRTAPKVIAVIKPLGADSVKKAEEWITAIDARLKTAQKTVNTRDYYMRETEEEGPLFG